MTTSNKSIKKNMDRGCGRKNNDGMISARTVDFSAHSLPTEKATVVGSSIGS